MHKTKYNNIRNMAHSAQGMCWRKHKASTSPTFSQYVNKVCCYMYDWVTWWSESARTPQIVKHPTNISKHITNLILPMWSFNHCVIWYLWKWYLREMKVWMECKYNKIWTLYIKKHTYLILYEWHYCNIQDVPCQAKQSPTIKVVSFWHLHLVSLSLS